MIINFDNFLNELFDNNRTYPFTLDDSEFYKDLTVYRYSFITKDKIKYSVVFTILTDKRIGKFDFSTSDLNDSKFSYNPILLINKFDSIKVFSTLKEIVLKHKNEISKLIISSREDRIKFYEKLLTYMKVRYKKDKQGALIASI
jgi:hypothetical protein